MQIWDELISIAILGTEREHALSLQAPGALGSLLAKLKYREPLSREASVLSTAAAVELYRRAGALPEKAEPDVRLREAPPDNLQQCSARAEVLLIMLIEDRAGELLKEWLRLAHENGRRVPPVLLPDLLQLALHNMELRQPVVDAGGHRARWLASYNGAWSFVLQAGADGGDDRAIWETGQMSERVGALRAMRRSGPQLAIQLLSATWSQEPADARIEFISQLHVNLSMYDEPFLEEVALDDRRKEVRELAAQLLARLPESRLSRRMISRVDACIELQQHRHHSELNVVALPEECDQAMIRDGISNKQLTNLGEKADRLVQIISAVHPDHWSERFGADAIKFTTIAHNSTDWRDLLLLGLRHAIERYQSVAWAEALIPIVSPYIGNLMDCLPAHQREAYLVRALKDSKGLIKGSMETEQALNAVLGSDCMLSLECSQVLLETWKKEWSPHQQIHNPLARLLPLLALRLNYGCLQSALTGWRDELIDDSTTRKLLEKFMETVQFRDEIYRELTGAGAKELLSGTE